MQGVLGVSVTRLEESGWRKQAWSWPRRSRAATRLCLLAEVEGDRFALVGWASATVLGQLGCQVSVR